MDLTDVNTGSFPSGSCLGVIGSEGDIKLLLLDVVCCICAADGNCSLFMQGVRAGGGIF